MNPASKVPWSMETKVTSATAFKKGISGYMNQGKWIVGLLLDRQTLCQAGVIDTHIRHMMDLGGVFA